MICAHNIVNSVKINRNVFYVNKVLVLINNKIFVVFNVKKIIIIKRDKNNVFHFAMKMKYKIMILKHVR